MTPPNGRPGPSEVAPPEATQAGHQAPASPAAPRLIAPPRERRALGLARDRLAARDATAATVLARRVAILEGVVRTLSDELEAYRAIAGGVWAPEPDPITGEP